MTNNVEFGVLFYYIAEEIILTVKLQEICLVLVIYCSKNLTERKGWSRNFAFKIFSSLTYNLGLIPYS